jgi:hypothetical protein
MIDIFAQFGLIDYEWNRARSQGEAESSVFHAKIARDWMPTIHCCALLCNNERMFPNESFVCAPRAVY